MWNFFGRVSKVFAAGAFAGLVQSVVLWLLGLAGLFGLLVGEFDFPINLGHFSQRMVVSGVWAFLFLVPLLRTAPHWRRGLWIGLLRALFTLLLTNPFVDQVGFLGLNFGWAWPLIVLFSNLLWGFLAGYWLDKTAELTFSPPAEQGG